MDVFLIPTTTSERYQLYYEAPDEEEADAGEGSGIVHRVKMYFAEILREAEEWRHRRHELAPEPTGVLARLRRKVMGFIVERIAEQRLLWHMRKATEICARIPSDVSEGAAELVIRATLKKDADHHLRWLIIDFLLMLLVAPLVLIPGPNVPGFYFAFQVASHFLSWRGAKQGLTAAKWTYKSSADLAELREAMKLAAPHRQRRFRELAGRLRLEHLETFLEDVAAPAA